MTWSERASRSADALEAEYGLFGSSVSVSTKDPGSVIEPYTSSVEMWRNRSTLC